MNSRYFVAAALALALAALLSWSVAAAKIEHFKDEKGILHISNSGEGESKGKTSPTPPGTVVEPPPDLPQPGEVVEEPPVEAEPPPEGEAPPEEEAMPPPNE